MAEEPNPRAVIGGNAPPTQEDLLRANNAELLARVPPLLERAEKLPKAIKIPKHLETYGAFVVDAEALVKDLEKQREIDKKPHWDAGKAVDKFFGDVKTSIATVIASVQGVANAYAKEQQRLERERQAAEEARLREAQRLADQRAADAARARPAAPSSDSLLDDEDELDVAPPEVAVAAPSGPVFSDKMTLGNDVTLSTSAPWVGEIVDIEKLDLEKLRPYIARKDLEAALTRFVKVGNRTLRGAVIRQEIKAKFK